MIEPNDPVKRFEPLWGSWYADELLGEGSYGRVYRIIRHDSGGTYYSACKHITIPKNDAEVQNARAMGMDQRSMYTYFNDVASRIVNEINIMYALRGENNIVAYEDHFIAHQEGSLQWDVFIRMELLVPLSTYIYSATSPMGPDEVRRLGVEICSALEACAAYSIIHRDIKEGNVFLNPRGTFKLGDFGIAKELSSGSMSMSMRGTPSYIAPEIYNGKRYDASVDLYSLGILMYKLLNDNRYPFFPPAPEAITMENSEQAFTMRMQGDTPPRPRCGDDALKNAVMKAIRFDPRRRFSSAAEMKAALLGHVVAPAPRAQEAKPEQVNPTPAAEAPKGEAAEAQAHAPSAPAKKKSGKGVMVGVAVGAAVVAILVFTLTDYKIEAGAAFIVMLILAFVFCGDRVHTEGDFDVYIHGGITLIADYNGKAESIDIPKSIGGCDVTGISSWAFEKCSSLTNITIPNSLLNIGNNAFDGCTSLISIIIPASVTSIDKSAFSGCHNLTIHAPEGSYAHSYAEENNIPFILEP